MLLKFHLLGGAAAAFAALAAACPSQAQTQAPLRDPAVEAAPAVVVVRIGTPRRLTRAARSAWHA